MKRYKDTKYLVTEDGQVFSEVSGKFLKPQKRKYLGVDLGRGKPELIHRMVAYCYCENPNDYKEVNHKDGNKMNNHYSNLEWCTRSQNAKHGVDLGLIPRMQGERNGHSKLTEKEVIQIRQLYNQGVRIADLCRQFGLKSPAMHSLVNHKSWKHLK
jgi:hypothetical protein